MPDRMARSEKSRDNRRAREARRTVINQPFAAGMTLSLTVCTTATAKQGQELFEEPKSLYSHSQPCAIYVIFICPVFVNQATLSS